MKIRSVIIGGMLILSMFVTSAEVDKDTAKSQAIAKGNGKGTELGISSATTLTSTEAVVDGEGEALSLASSTIEVMDSPTSVNTHGIAKSMTMTIENPAVTIEISHSMANSNTVAKANDDGYCAGGSLVYAGTEIEDTGTGAVASTYAEADGSSGYQVSVDHDHMMCHEVTITSSK